MVDVDAGRRSILKLRRVLGSRHFIGVPSIKRSPMTADEPRVSSPDDIGRDIPQPPRLQSGIRRRELMLTTATTLLFSTNSVLAGVVQSRMPWEPNAGAPPTAV